jgi:hypothetical protein
MVSNHEMSQVLSARNRFAAEYETYMDTYARLRASLRRTVTMDTLLAAFLSAAMLFTSAAQAMEIRQFDKMALQDQNDFIGDLVVGAQKVLIDEGRSDLAAQVQNLFAKMPAGDQISLGLNEFERNLDLLRVADAKNAAARPNDPRIEVEDAMVVTLKKNNIQLPDSFFGVASNFKPKFPPRSEDKKN